MDPKDKFFDKHGFDQPIADKDKVVKRPGTQFIRECGCDLVQLIQLKGQVYAITMDKNGCPSSIDNVTDVIKPNGGIH